MAFRKFIWKEAILYEDDHIIGIDKPPFLPALSDRINDENLLDIGRRVHEDLQLAHRLDRDTSGVILFAKDPESYRHLSLQFEHRKVKKIYHAVCDGVHEFRKEKLNAALYTSSKGIVKVDPRRGKESTTYFNTIKAFSKHTLMECRPLTGRTHQIRVHLAHSGAPISGDEKYGGKLFYLSDIKKKYNLKKYTEEEPLIKRMALHARSIEFSNMDNKSVTITSEYPKDMRVMLKQLEQNA